MTTFSTDHSEAGTDFLVKDIDYRYTSGTVILANNCDGDKPLSVDDGLVVEVTRQDGTTAGFSHDFSSGCSGSIGDAGPFGMTSLLRPGVNRIRFRFRDNCGQGGSSSLRIALVRGP